MVMSSKCLLGKKGLNNDVLLTAVPGEAALVNGKYFQRFGDPKAWNQARDACAKKGGRLAVFDRKNIEIIRDKFGGDHNT